MTTSEIALIVGAGAGLSAALARLCTREGMRVALAARNTQKLAALAQQTGARVYGCDASQADAVQQLFASVVQELGEPDLVVYNPSFWTRGPITSLDPAGVAQTLAVTCYGGFLVGQAAAQRMVPRGHGTILFTGATASVKGFAESAPFAMGKFGLRGLAQSMARELAPKNIHVGHFVIDGVIRPSSTPAGNDQQLDPDAIAANYLHLHRQPRSAWTWEVELRPWLESF